jgi:hypothetical protein
MLIRHFIPVALLFLVLVCTLMNSVGVPVFPIALITLLGEFLVLIQLEDNKIANFIANLVDAFRHPGHHGLHHH